MNKLFYFNINYECNSNCLFCAANYGIDPKHKGIPVDQFVQSLEDMEVSPGDRVIINGGEPTLHPGFLKMLASAHQRGAFIDLYTNGTKLADEAFTEKILQFSPILIRIPIFGASAETHDELTGHKGSFRKIMKAFEILAREDEQREDLYVEVKLLMSKATIGENTAILQMMMDKFPNAFYFSLNPLITSKKVLQHRETLVSPLSNLVSASEEVIDLARSQRKRIDINLIPFCLVPERFRHLLFVPDKRLTDQVYTDPFQQEMLKNKFETDMCNHCYYRIGCKGFPEHYFDAFDDSEVSPIQQPFHTSKEYI